MPPPTPSRRPPNKTLLVALGSLAVFIVGCSVIVGVASDDDSSDPKADDKAPAKAEPTKKASTTPSKKPKPSPSPSPTAAPKTDLEIITDEIVGDSDTEDQNVTVKETRKGVYEVGFDIDDNLSSGLIESGAIRDCFSILEEAKKADAPFKRIAIRGYFPLVDNLGKDIPHDKGWILYGEFTAETIKDLEPDNLDTGDRDTLDAVSADGLVFKDYVFG